MEVCYHADGTRPFLQKNLKTRLPAGEGVFLVENHFHDKGMEFSNVRAVWDWPYSDHS